MRRSAGRLSKADAQEHDQELHRSGRFHFNSRLALVAGFGSVLVIMTLAGFDALRVLRDVRRNDDQIRRQFLFQNHVLNDVRFQVYLSGTYVRDYLLEPEPERAKTFRTGLEQVRQQMDSALESYGRQLAPAEVKHYTALRAELAQYWRGPRSGPPVGCRGAPAPRICVPARRGISAQAEYAGDGRQDRRHQ